MRLDSVKVDALARLYALCFDLGYEREAFDCRWRLWSLIWSPFIPENDRYRMIFIHVPKTGGMTALASLFGIERQLGHKPALAYQLTDVARFSAYFKLCIVRNPWDRAASAFFFLKRGGANEADRRWAQRHLGDFEEFPAFVRALANRRLANRIIGWKHFLPQSFYITDRDGKLLVDHLARQEKLDIELSQLAKRFGVRYTPRRRNASERLPYQVYYDDETREIINDIYRVDIALLGYSFEATDQQFLDERLRHLCNPIESAEPTSGLRQ